MSARANPGGFGPLRRYRAGHSWDGFVYDDEVLEGAIEILTYAGFAIRVTRDEGGEIGHFETDAPAELVLATVLQVGAAVGREVRARRRQPPARSTRPPHEDQPEPGDRLPGNPECPSCGDDEGCAVIDGHGGGADGAAVLIGRGLWRLAWHCDACDADGWWMPAFAFSSGAVAKACPNCASSIERVTAHRGLKRGIEEWECTNRVDCGMCVQVHRATGMFS